MHYTFFSLCAYDQVIYLLIKIILDRNSDNVDQIKTKKMDRREEYLYKKPEVLLLFVGPCIFSKLRISS